MKLCPFSVSSVLSESLRKWASVSQNVQTPRHYTISPKTRKGQTFSTGHRHNAHCLRDVPVWISSTLSAPLYGILALISVGTSFIRFKIGDNTGNIQFSITKLLIFLLTENAKSDTIEIYLTIQTQGETIMREKFSAMHSISFTPSMYEKIKKSAKQFDASVSDIVRECVDRELNRLIDREKKRQKARQK